MAQKLIDALPTNETKVGRYAYQFSTGTFEALSPTARRAISVFTNFEYLTKIASGTAIVAQLTQPLISFWTVSGTKRTLEGILRLMDKPTIQAMREFGVGGASKRAMYSRLGVENAGKLMDKLRELHPGAKGFEFVNLGLDFSASSVGEVSLRNWWKSAQKPGFRGNIARRKLKQFGADWEKPITDYVDKKFQIDYMMETQLHPRVTREPLWMNDPRFRFLALFKRFGYKQAVLIKDHVYDELKHGNVMPFLRIAAGGAVGGHLVKKAKDLIKEAISGKAGFS
jgi:hypothetical protein